MKLSIPAYTVVTTGLYRNKKMQYDKRFGHPLPIVSGARDVHLLAIVQNASQLWQPPPDALAASAMYRHLGGVRFG